MRQTHVAGERMFVYYAGTKLAVVDATTGEVLTPSCSSPYRVSSSYTLAEATWTQSPS